MMLRATAAHLGAAEAPTAAPAAVAPPDSAEPLSPRLPWGRLLTHATPLPALLGDEARATAIRSELLEHGLVCFRPASAAAPLLTADEFTFVMARLNPGALSEADALARMKTYESTPADTSQDAADPEALDCPKAHLEGDPHVRLLGSERDAATGHTKQLLCETGYEWHTDNVGPSQTSLYCRHPLSAGGETIFTSSARMCEYYIPTPSILDFRWPFPMQNHHFSGAIL